MRYIVFYPKNFRTLWGDRCTQRDRGAKKVVIKAKEGTQKALGAYRAADQIIYRRGLQKGRLSWALRPRCKGAFALGMPPIAPNHL